MTTYATYKCDTCKRSIETEVDPRRPTFTHCNITYKCLGRLKFQGTKSVRTHLITSPVAGLTDWKPRNEAPIRQETQTEPTYISVCNEHDLLTIAVPAVDVETETLTLQLEAENTNPLFFSQYTYFGFTVAVSTITGADSTTDHRILRYNVSGPTPDTVKVNVNGVQIPRAVRAAGHVTVNSDGTIGNFVIDQEGSLYDEPPTIIFGGNGSGAAATASITDGAVTDVVITSVGNNYSGSVPVSFVDGITSQMVHYLGDNSIDFVPAIPAGSRVEIAVVPYVAPIILNLTFNRHNLATASVGAWSNISSVKIGITQSLFTCNDLSILNMGTHLTPISLSDGNTQYTDWCFLLSQSPHQNVDRKYSILLDFDRANLYRALNPLGVPDVMVDEASFTSIYPPLSIIAPRIIPDAIDTTTVSQLDDDMIDKNDHILGFAQ